MPTENKREVRVRIAPSPTGPLHFGTARTALFNWLFAKSTGGAFILRIEDTDLERSDTKYEEEIIAGLAWLGLEWDEGPVRQSERLEVYEKHLKRLLEEGKAYYCYCTKEDLEEERQAMMAQGLAPKYSGRCRNRAASGSASPQLIRFRMPETAVSFKDMIRGKITFDAALFGDIAIAKNLRAPLYNFAAVVDDHEMRISHVIRGEDHISNTPKQLLLQDALGFAHPDYGHLPLILSADRSKMSKRYAETSLLAYREGGYLPEAMFNFMALMGWHPRAEEREIYSKEELIKVFDIKRVQKAGAVFNQEKLDWLNAQYVRTLSDNELAEHLRPLLAARGLAWNDTLLTKVAAIEKSRAKTLGDIITNGELYFSLPDYDAKLLVWQNASFADIRERLARLEEMLQNAPEKEFTVPALTATLMPYAEEKGRGTVLWPFRVALSGRQASPGPFELAAALGKEETLRRLGLALQKLGLV
ncbi:MAG: glutamate--tRNA ligase [Candidatus Liptonbacteria bacterium GWC1_60_9]|uniref:Glutamate--tRNA ligase n=3 Tax=Candidatus Liptoniibacteriota TaxID=1817909 RepID=A0A1G2CMT1_9BACT|nr:MAG: glutamate--tRNA ligase [Candidatus Liptonbacteria bacterium GWC1_60_9]OGZ00170.1 MAG: glutamate--tRNA ligase [Candidatus Liptonbacteria bacterium RIFCSPHIGHO2_12_FULL_60_13]OGZ02693.1 MAG: glutamate--tRNA ligase [Candidatus Liptonbacteria bacterium RIFCSPLOWO2_12_FULL_60_15]